MSTPNKPVSKLFNTHPKQAPQWPPFDAEPFEDGPEPSFVATRPVTRSRTGARR